jgi:hypothetical protein
MAMKPQIALPAWSACDVDKFYAATVVWENPSLLSPDGRRRAVGSGWWWFAQAYQLGQGRVRRTKGEQKRVVQGIMVLRQRDMRIRIRE